MSWLGERAEIRVVDLIRTILGSVQNGKVSAKCPSGFVRSIHSRVSSRPIYLRELAFVALRTNRRSRAQEQKCKLIHCISTSFLQKVLKEHIGNCVVLLFILLAKEFVRGCCLPEMS